jgi:hypothetical protein
LSFYVSWNISESTPVVSGVSLRYALDAMGGGNVMFPIDYSFAARFIEQARISETERAQVASGNTRQIPRLEK